MKLGKLSIVALLVVFASNAMAINGMFKTQFAVGETAALQSSVENKADGKLLYFGGPVISKAKVYTVFWGEGVNASVKAEMPAFYASVLNSSYMDWMTIYSTNVTAVDGRAGTNQTIGRGTYEGTLTLKPSITATTIDDADIQAELERQVKAGSLPAPDADTLYMIHFPKGVSITMHDGSSVATSCQQFCAYHNGFKTESGAAIYYGAMPDLSSVSCSFGCGMGLSLLDRTTVTSSHELIEAITDPFPTPGTNPSFPQAWNTVDGYEIADLCQAGSSTLKTSAKSYKLSNEWNNSTGSCTKNDWVGQ